MHLTRHTASRTPTRSESLLLVTLLIATAATAVPIGPAVRSQPSDGYLELSSPCGEACTDVSVMPAVPDARIASIWRP